MVAIILILLIWDLFMEYYEYQRYTRNARVYYNRNPSFGVELFDSLNDYQEYKSFVTLDEAERYAEKWIKCYDDTF